MLTSCEDHRYDKPIVAEVEVKLCCELCVLCFLRQGCLFDTEVVMHITIGS